MTSVAFPVSAATSTLVATPGSVTADGVSTTTLTVTVEDAHGNAIAGTAVTLSGSGSATASAPSPEPPMRNGVFTTTLASTVAQTETITATEGSVHEIGFGDLQSGRALGDHLDPGGDPGIGDGGRRIHHHADGDGGGCPGQPRSERGGDAVGQRHRNSFGTISGTTNANGVFTTTLASTVAQTETITATEGSVHEIDLGDLQSGRAVGDHLDPGSDPGIGDGGRCVHHHADGDGGRCPGQSRSERGRDAVGQRHRRTASARSPGPPMRTACSPPRSPRRWRRPRPSPRPKAACTRPLR